MLQAFLIFLFVAFMVFHVCMFCSNQQQRREQEAAAGAGEANQELTTTRQTMSSRRRQASQQRQQQQQQQQISETSAPPADDTPEERVDRIKKNLFSRIIERPESIRSLENILKAAEERYDVNQNGNVITRSYRAAASSVRTLGERECIICLDTYEPGDTICWAKTDRCNHILHEECAIEWLKNHDECPICRTDIVNFMGD